MVKEISAGIIIYKKAKEGIKFLLLYHGHDYWNFPKGKIESEEKSLEAAIRETREETGLLLRDLKLNRHFKAYEKFYFWRPSEQKDGKSQRVFKIVIFYLAEGNRSHIRTSDYHEGYGWFTYNEALKIVGKYRDTKNILTQANNFLKGGRIKKS